MQPSRPEGRQGWAVVAAWGVLLLTSAGMAAIGLRTGFFDLDPIGLLLYVALLVALGKASVDALAER